MNQNNATETKVKRLCPYNCQHKDKYSDCFYYCDLEPKSVLLVWDRSLAGVVRTKHCKDLRILENRTGVSIAR